MAAVSAVVAGGAALAGLTSSIIGAVSAGADRAQAEKLMKEAMEEINSVGAPPDLSREIILQKFQQAGLYTPELESAIDLGVSKVSQIKEDAGLRDAQKGALELLTQRGKSGLMPEDRAALNQVRAEVQRDTEAKRQQILQNMQARGLAGGGAELAMQLQASQAGANTASAEGDRLAAQASQNALQAMVQGGQLAGNIRGQDFDVNSTRAAAEDEVNRFNVQNSIGRQTRNVGMGNDAQQRNLGERQRIQDANTGQGNNELYRQRDAEAEEYRMKMAAAQAKANARTGASQQAMQQGNQTAQNWHTAGQGVAAAGSVIANNLAKKPKNPYEWDSTDG